jgi:hypothetical protein
MCPSCPRGSVCAMKSWTGVCLQGTVSVQKQDGVWSSDDPGVSSQLWKPVAKVHEGSFLKIPGWSLAQL